MKDSWFNQHLAGTKSSLPFSFVYDGQPSAKWLAEWPKTAKSQPLDKTRTQ